MFVIVDGYAYLVKESTGYKVSVDVDGNLNVISDGSFPIFGLGSAIAFKNNQLNFGLSIPSNPIFGSAV